MEARIDGEWGGGAVILTAPDGEVFRAPLPQPMIELAKPGRRATLVLAEGGRFLGWSIPDEKVGARVRADRPGEPATLACKGPCGTLWHLVSGGRGWAEDACLVCRGEVAGPHQAES